MSKFIPVPKQGFQYSVKGKKITVLKFDDTYVTYTTSDSQVVDHVNVNKWNSLNAKEASQANHDTTDHNGENKDNLKSDQSSNSKQSENSTTTSFTFEYDDATGTFTIKKDGKPITEPWIIKGTNGESGKSAYEEWAKEHQGNFNDFINSLKGINGANGQNGASTFDLWLARQNSEHPGNMDDFFQSLKGRDGENGKNGASAYEVWKSQGNPGNEKDFFNSLKGVNGKNGENGTSVYDLWLAKNKQRSIDDFLVSLKGADGKPGKDGLDGASAFQIWKNEGYEGDEVDFLNWIQEARKGEKGDPGDIFRPHFDERGNLYFRNQKGETTNPESVKGDRGKEGSQGKSAYEIWKDNGYLGSEEDFLESLKGRDGSIPSPPKYGYKDVKDFHLPQFKINPQLFSFSDNLTDNRTPEQIMYERIEEIKSIREQGKEKRCDWFKEFTWWCAGADKELLRMCPADHTKNMGIGTVILFTAIMAAFSGYIAIELIFDLWWVRILFCTFWGSMIFFLDRFITNTMYSDGEVKISRQEFRNALPRIVIAIFLGIVISAPIELRIFKEEIREECVRHKTSTNNEYLAQSEIVKTYKENWDNNLQKNQKTIDEKKEEDYTREKPIDGEKKTSPVQLYDSIAKKMVTKYIKIETKKTVTEKNLEDYKAAKQTAKSFKDQQAKEDSIRYYNSLSTLNRLEKSLNDKFNNEYYTNTGLLSLLFALHSIAMKDYKPWDWASYITNDGKTKGSFWDSILHVWWYFLIFTPIGLIMLLLILIDISPVIYKMMLADGLYDNYLHQEKTFDQFKMRIGLLKAFNKLDSSNFKQVTPYIFGEDEYKKITNSANDFQKLTPIQILIEKKPDYMETQLNEKNKKLFDEVLDMKRRIILATYRRWYKTQHDAIIGDPMDDENLGKEPFKQTDIPDMPKDPVFSEN
ncbi:MAG: DUF4407 domain-containing protein [Bacteroidales bacterium]|nr:DUF4407 domain-containing protein [Bacteroidales bacterium]